MTTPSRPRRPGGMRTLYQSAMAAVIAGTTTLEEVSRVVDVRAGEAVYSYIAKDMQGNRSQGPTGTLRRSRPCGGVVQD